MLAIGIIGFAKYESHFENTTFGYVTQAFSKLKYSFLDVIVGIVIILQAVVINHNETKKQLMIDKPWNVKEPDIIRDLRISQLAENERNYQNKS